MKKLIFYLTLVFFSCKQKEEPVTQLPDPTEVSIPPTEPTGNQIISKAIVVFNAPDPTHAEFIKRVGPLTNSAPISRSGGSNIVLKNLNIETTGQYGIDIRGANGVTIINCRIRGARYRSVNLEQCSNVIFKNNLMDSVAWGAYFNQISGTMIADSNWLRKIWGMSSPNSPQISGVGMMINNSTVPGASMSYNYLVNPPGSSLQDNLSVHVSKGSATNKIKIRNNYIKGGGPSTSSGGILASDNGGGFVTVEGNVLINCGNYALASMGTDNDILNNKVYVKRDLWTNAGVIVWQPSTSVPCARNRVEGNKVWFIRGQTQWGDAGSHVEYWLPSMCSGTTNIGNVWGSTEMTETMPPPAGVPLPGGIVVAPAPTPVPVPTPAPTPVPAPTGVPTANAGVDRTVAPGTITLSGTITNIGNVAAMSWVKQSGGAATIVNPNATSVSSPYSTEVTGLVAGSYTFKLVVRSKAGVFYQDLITITVSGTVPPVKPIHFQFTSGTRKFTLYTDGTWKED